MTTKKQQELIGAIGQHPGATSAELAKALNTNPVNMAGRLLVLHDNKQVVRKGTGSRGDMFRYYLPDYFLQRPETAQPAAPAQPITTAVPEPSAFEALVTEFVDQLASRIAERLRPALVERLSKSVAVMATEIANRVQPETAPMEVGRKKRVMIGGVKQQQAAILEGEFKECLDLRFMTVDDTIDRWKSNAANADQVLLLTSFISHKHQDAVKSVGVKPVFINGGMSAVREELTKIYAEAA